jgi:hypothetical protein
MRAKRAECSVETAVEGSDHAGEAGGAIRARGSTETEADKIRRQQQIRRKAKIVRHALAANRTR